MRFRPDLLAILPVELLYEIQFYAASEALPLTCRRLHDIFKSAPLTVRVDYLATRYAVLLSIFRRRRLRPDLITYVLRFPVCTLPVLSALVERPTSIAGLAGTTTTISANDASRTLPYSFPRPELPRRLFRELSASGTAEVLPLLRYLYDNSRGEVLDDTKFRITWNAPDANSHDGYALVRAVNAGAVPLVHFLLDQGALPDRRDALAVKIAIKRRDLALVRLLVEPPDVCPEERRTGKRRRLNDRVRVNSEMLKLAVTCGAQDIAEYLVKEQDCVPDLETVYWLSTAKF